MDLAYTLIAAGAVLAGLVVESRRFAPGRHARRGEAIVWSVGWLAVAAVPGSAVAVTDGPAGEWATVYLIERSLSLDNVFLFTLLLAYFAVPAELRAAVITIGIAGALALRGLAIVGGPALVDAAESVVYLFGALLLYVAYRTFRGTAGEADPVGNPVLRALRHALPVTDGYRGRRLLVRARQAASTALRCCS